MLSKKNNKIILRSVKQDDLEIFFEHQLDKEANYMAAFTAKDPNDKKAYYEKWKKIKADKSIIIKTILYDGNVAGSIIRHGWFGDPEISYWIGKEFWGKGIATLALTEFLIKLKERSLYARAAKDNIASIRVLEKCGFEHYGEDKGFANARGKEIEEFIFKLS